MTTAARPAFGTKLQQLVSSAPDKYRTIAEVLSAEPPEATAKLVEVTNHDSPADAAGIGRAEFAPVLVDEGTLTLTANYVAADPSQALARASLATGLSNWQICLSDYGAVEKTFTVDVGTGVLSCAAHGLATGQPVKIRSTTGQQPGGTSAGAVYWANVIDGGSLTLHATNAGALAGSGKVDFTSAGGGTLKLRIGSVCRFAGVVESDRRETPLQDQQRLTLKLRATGLAVWTP